MLPVESRMKAVARRIRQRQSLDRATSSSLDSSSVNSSTSGTSSLLSAPEKKLITTMEQQHSATVAATTSIPPFVLKATAVASLGGILFGYDMGVISGALPLLSTHFDLTDRSKEVVVGILYLGGGLGAAVGGALCDRLGRWTSIVVTDVLFLVGALLLVWAPNLTILLSGRVVVGFAISVSGIADVAYLHELAPVNYRGAIVSVNEACISLGFLWAYVAGYGLSHLAHGWRAMFGLGGAMAMIQLVGMRYMPESPVWLKEKGRHDEAQQALRVIYGGEEHVPAPTSEPHEGDNEDELASTNKNDAVPRMPSRRPSSQAIMMVPNSYESLQQPPNDQQQNDLMMISHHAPGRPAVTRKLHNALHIIYRYRKQAYIAFFLSIAQQLSGQTIVLNYAPLIFSQLGSGNLSTTLYIGVVKFVMTVLVIWKIEQFGRRFLLLTGMTIIVFGLLLVMCAFSTGFDLDDKGEAINNQRGGMFWALPGVLCVVSGYSASFGPLTWLLTSELFPTDIRGRALGATTIVTYLCASLVTSTFLSAQAKLGANYLFGMYAFLTTLGIGFAYFAIPDTGGKTVAQTDETLMHMWWWRRQGYLQGVVTSAGDERPAPLEAELT